MQISTGCLSGISVLRTVPPNTEVFLRSLREKQILVWATGIQKEIGVSEQFYRNNEATIILKRNKIQRNVLCMAFFFQIKAPLSLKNVWLPPIFCLDTKSTF